MRFACQSAYLLVAYILHCGLEAGLTRAKLCVISLVGQQQFGKFELRTRQKSYIFLLNF